MIRSAYWNLHTLNCALYAVCVCVLQFSDVCSNHGVPALVCVYVVRCAYMSVSISTCRKVLG